MRGLKASFGFAVVMWFTQGRPSWENGQSLLCEKETNLCWSILLTMDDLGGIIRSGQD
jgi:hypothetical protein